VTESNGKFGAELRRLRTERGRSVGELSRKLGLSTAYLCQVESGKRAPLGTAEIQKAASFLKASPLGLTRLAVEDRAFVTVPVPPDAHAQTVLARLLVAWDTLPSDFFTRLDALLPGDPS